MMRAVGGMGVERVPCILCGSGQTEHFYTDKGRMGTLRDFFQCAGCHLVFVPPLQRLSREEELSRYELHENDPDDPRYRKFLERLFIPVNERLEPSSHGLDFGSGPGPALSVMLEEAGHTVCLYDAFYADDPTVFDRTYDFITTSETIEHLFYPMDELNRLWGCLKSGGWLGVMTKRFTDRESFRDWHYKNDDTHVAFYPEETFTWLAERWSARLEICGNDVVLFRKPDRGS